MEWHALRANGMAFQSIVRDTMMPWIWDEQLRFKYGNGITNAFIQHEEATVWQMSVQRMGTSGMTRKR